MSKRLILVILIVLVAGSTGLFAFGIGAQGGYVVSGTPNGALTFKLDTAPWVFALNIDNISTNGISFGLSADMWLTQKTFAKPFGYYYGWGLAGALSGTGNYINLTACGRFLVGVNCFFIKSFELYLQAAWQPGIKIFLGSSGGIEPIFTSFPVNLGFRFWL